MNIQGQLLFGSCPFGPAGARPLRLRGRSARSSLRGRFARPPGDALRGPLLSARAERRGRKARQREGLFTKPPFPLESHPPRIAFPPRLTLPCALPRSARPAQSRCGGKCRRTACTENWPVDTRKNPICHSERSEESRCKLALDSSSLALLRMTDGEDMRVFAAASVGADTHIGPPTLFLVCCFFSLRRGNALRGPLLSARAERRGRKARQREGLFTKPPFPLESHPPRIVCQPHLTDAVRAASLRSARAIAVRREMSGDGLIGA